MQGTLQEHEGDSSGHQEDVPQPGQEVPQERHRQEGDRSLQEVNTLVITIFVNNSIQSMQYFGSFL